MASDLLVNEVTIKDFLRPDGSRHITYELGNDMTTMDLLGLLELTKVFVIKDIER